MRDDLTKKRFIEETYRIISTEGIEALSIRRIGSEMHCNTANIYRHFKDLDELVTYASLRYLAEYLKDVAECYKVSRNTLHTHLMVWELFARHAFSHPRLFDKLFFSQHSSNLEEIVRDYYSIFPEDMAGIAPALEAVFMTGSFDKRDFLLISRCVDEGYFTPEDARYLNTLSIHLFMGYLKDLLSRETPADSRDALLQSFTSCLNRVIDSCTLK